MKGEVSRTRVVIVAYGDSMAQTLTRALAGAGYDCYGASTADAIGTQLGPDPDLAAVLCDIRFPFEPRFRLLAQLAADFPGLAVVVTTDFDEPEIAELAREMGVGGYLVKPFTTNEVLIAVSNALQRRRLEAANQRHIEGWEQVVSRFGALSTALRRLATEAPGADEDTLEQLSRAISLWNGGRHYERVAAYSAILAEAIGYSRDSVELVRRATMLHDIGQVGVPDSILEKPGPLSSDEYKLVQRHAPIGYRLLAPSAWEVLGTAASVALAHHERWDGSGYPMGLSGDAIPALARIAAVTDVFDALTSDRVYRPALPVEEAVAVMAEGRGRQFEPRLVDAFFGATDQVMAVRLSNPDPDDQEPPARVLLVGDNEVVVQGLVRALGEQPSLKVLGVAQTAAEAQKAAIIHDPDIVLIDSELPDGVTAVERIRALAPTAKVTMLVGSADPDGMARAIEAGCAGFVPKNVSPKTLADSIWAHDGEPLLGVASLPEVISRIAALPPSSGLELGPRELEVLQLVAAGLPNRAIAERLYISVHTVRNHVKHILGKLSAHSKLQAVAIAVSEGLIER
jgi:putative two-component system response regulator